VHFTFFLSFNPEFKVKFPVPPSEREGGREREPETEFYKELLSITGGLAVPAHGLRVTTRFPVSPPTHGGVASYMAKTFPGL
jgi:hypothetical protein